MVSKSGIKVAAHCYLFNPPIIHLAKMAEVSEAVRRREIRRRKILENSEARWKKIVGGDSADVSNSLEDSLDQPRPEINHEISGTIKMAHSNPPDPLQVESHGSFSSSSSSPFNRTTSDNQEHISTESDRLSAIYGNCSYTSSSRNLREANEANGPVKQIRSRQTYSFPKKVSDAETRSYGRTKADARRSSSCTQLIIEILQLSSVGFADIRHWLVMLVAICTRLWFSSNNGFLLMKSVFFPFLLLELAVLGYLNWSRKLVQRPSHSLLGAALLLCGIPSSIVTSFVHYQNLIRQIIKDCVIFIFSFVLSHVIFENWMCS